MALDPSTLKEFPQGSIEYQLDRQFVDEHVAAYRADLQKAAEKLGLELNEENLPVIAREMRVMKAADVPVQQLSNNPKMEGKTPKPE